MTDERSNFRRYKIILIKLDLSCDWLYNFIILKLSFLLGVNFKEHIGI